MKSVRVSFLNVICLHNVLYILVKYHENILTCFKVMVRTKFYNSGDKGDNSWTKSVRVVFLVPDTPTKCPLQPDSLLKIAPWVVRSYGVHNNAFMDRQMDGWMDSMLIAISPKPFGRRKIQQKVLMV